MTTDTYTPQEFRYGYRKGEQRARELSNTELSELARSLSRQWDSLTMHDRGYFHAIKDELEYRTARPLLPNG